MGVRLQVILCLLVALLPLVPNGDTDAPRAVGFPGWPAEFEGRALTPREPDEMLRRFEEELPGRRAAGFGDGDRSILIRWVPHVTRKVHPAAECFRALGYEIRPLPSLRDAAGTLWSRFLARRDSAELVVREQVRDGAGRTFPDPSAWFWASLLGRTSGAAWTYTVVSRPPPPLDE